MANDSIDAPAGDDDRQRGVLTPDDRLFIRRTREEREKNYSRQAASDANSRIPLRAVNSIKDFSVLFRHLDDDKRAEIGAAFETETPKDPVFDVPKPPLPNPLSDTIAFLFLLHDDLEAFEMNVYRGLSDARRTADLLSLKVTVNLGFEAWSDIDLEQMKQKVENGNIDALAREERDYLIHHVEPDALAAVFGDEPDDGGEQDG